MQELHVARLCCHVGNIRPLLTCFCALFLAHVAGHIRGLFKFGVLLLHQGESALASVHACGQHRVADVGVVTQEGGSGGRRGRGRGKGCRY